MGLRCQQDLVKTVLAAGLAFALLTGCQKGPDSVQGPSYPGQTPEKPYSATPIAYPNPVTTVTATARFDRYIDTGANGLNSIQSGQPIRFAEVHILDASGNQIQQGETDVNGNISLPIPRSAGSYTLRVNSRAENAQYKVSVLKDPYSTEYYSLDKSFSLAGTETSSAVTMDAAPATNDSSVLGGAFNILDQIYKANEFLRSQAYSASCPMCQNDFTVAPKVQIFWQKGLTPATYFGSPTVPISFFLAESGSGLYRGIYMLGGVENSVCTDTDHFDNSVILHEYGHFLENAFSKSASPGGAHDGDSVIDPRLAWSEGWADFFQAAVLGRSYYRDTKRNGGCPVIGISTTAQLSFPDFDLETQANNDVPTTNQGIFREISIARTLYDVMTGATQSATFNMTNNTDSYAADMGFAPIWHAFKTIGTSTYRFQNMGQFNAALKSYSSSYSGTIQQDVTDILTYERQADSEILYGRKLTPQNVTAGTCSFSIASGGPKSFNTLINNNAFYRYDYDGSAEKAELLLRYRKTAGAQAAPYDLDLAVYFESHTLLDEADFAGQSARPYPESGGNATNLGFERISLAGRPAGTYMINVSVYLQTASYVGATTGYYLETQSGAQLCP